MRPSPALQGRIKNRLRFTTKDVGKGFYRGTGTGSLGSHTKYGNYLIDWRKVRHYVVPNLSETKLTPFVSGNIYKDAELPLDPDRQTYDPKKVDGQQYLNWWARFNETEYQWYVEAEEQERQAAEEQEANSTQDSANAQDITPTR